MLSFRQALVLGILQGISELFPISSLGHSIILPALLGWTISQEANYFLTFLVATHFATAAVLFLLYQNDWVRIIRSTVRSIWRTRLANVFSVPLRLNTQGHEQWRSELAKWLG